MSRLETLDEDLTIQPTREGMTDLVVEATLDSKELRRILERMHNGEYTERKLYSDLFDLLCVVEAHIAVGDQD